MTYAKKVWKDGETITKEALNNLESGVSANDTAIQQFSQKIGAISGIAPLDSSGKVPKANIPEIFSKTDSINFYYAE